LQEGGDEEEAIPFPLRGNDDDASGSDEEKYPPPSPPSPSTGIVSPTDPGVSLRPEFRVVTTGETRGDSGVPERMEEVVLRPIDERETGEAPEVVIEAVRRDRGLMGVGEKASVSTMK